MRGEDDGLRGYDASTNCGGGRYLTAGARYASLGKPWTCLLVHDIISPT